MTISNVKTIGAEEALVICAAAMDAQDNGSMEPLGLEDGIFVCEALGSWVGLVVADGFVWARAGFANREDVIRWTDEV